MEFISALLSIVLIDLVLAGDNAIVIGLAARNVPKERQKKVILLGTLGAVIIRVIATLAVTWLLGIPGLLLIGGLLLIWIAYKLLTDKKDHEIAAKDTAWAAIRTILIADAAMGIDNVLAVAGAAHGSIWLVIVGLLISVPIVVWGSTLFIRLLDRFPWILYLGAGVLAYTAAKMIVDEPLLESIPFLHGTGKWIFEAVLIAAVVGVGYIRSRKTATQRKDSLPASPIKSPDDSKDANISC
ncbi:TerC family protein [Gorillibacterium massiliense]|uniref:TerC family protein n=1 Tax=Gorillibacterium massiliense TaxID=1280390 RepID=UPI0004B3DB41|nr:TerC family protein [Gorillibacterium massiliense]